jgi:Fe2+ transport system protein FeoA
MERLSDAQDSALKVVHEITAEPLVRERLLEMGLAPGRSVRRLAALPFGGPIIVQAGSLFLALRLNEARNVWVV